MFTDTWEVSPLSFDIHPYSLASPSRSISDHQKQFRRSNAYNVPVNRWFRSIQVCLYRLHCQHYDAPSNMAALWSVLLIYDRFWFKTYRILRRAIKTVNECLRKWKLSDTLASAKNNIDIEDIKRVFYKLNVNYVGCVLFSIFRSLWINLGSKFAINHNNSYIW